MFGNKITSTTLTSAVANRAFEKINAQDFRGDVTLLATARALFGPRNKEFNSYILDFDRSNFASDEVKPYLHSWIECNMGENTVGFVNIRRTEYLDEVYETLDGLMKDLNFEMNEPGSMFLTQFCNDKRVAVYNGDHQSVVATMEISMHQWHALVSGLTACYAQWGAERGQYTETEIKMIQSLVDPEMGVDDYMDAVESIASECFDFQTEAKRFYLDGFEKRAIQSKIRSLRDRAASLMREISNYQDTLRSLYDNKAGVDSLLNAALNGAATGDNELMDYFISNKKLLVDSVSDDDTLTYFVGGYIDNFDVDTFERCLENHGSVIYNEYESTSPRGITKEDYISLMKAVFLDETVKMKVYSKWRIGTGGYIEAVGDADPPIQLKDYLPNPHLVYFRCYGSFEPELVKAASECDYIRAVDISSAENGNVNFNDVTVMSRFIRDILTEKSRFLELPEGMAVTATEAIAWLKAQDEQA